MNENNNTNSGIGFLGLLAILFIALKLTGVITWSWWLVLLPLWGGLVLWAAIMLIIVFVVMGLNK